MAEVGGRASDCSKGRIWWPDDVDHILRGDLIAAAAYTTDAGGAVVNGVAPCGMSSREDSTVGFTTSLGIAKKLEHIICHPRVSLAYHTREHGFAISPRYVIVQGTASVDLAPSTERLKAFLPQAERFLGDLKSGPVWDRLLHEYYYERVFVDIDVDRVVAWPDFLAGGNPEVFGAPLGPPPEPQSPPRLGCGPRVDVGKTVGRLSSLPYRLLAYRGGDGYPIVVPVSLGDSDETGITLVAAASLPEGGRRAGLLGHSFRPQVVGLSTRSFTGWLDVSDGRARYAPHTSKGFMAVPNKTALLIANGLYAKLGMWQARRRGAREVLEKMRSDVSGISE